MSSKLYQLVDALAAEVLPLAGTHGGGGSQAKINKLRAEAAAEQVGDTTSTAKPKTPTGKVVYPIGKTGPNIASVTTQPVAGIGTPVAFTQPVYPPRGTVIHPYGASHG